MHTDEFEISLSRELKVCENTIKRIKKTISLMERKYNLDTNTFLEKYRAGMLSADAGALDDYRVWADTAASLDQWLDLERQYQEQFRKMKI